jgi:hypothetical protein
MGFKKQKTKKKNTFIVIPGKQFTLATGDVYHHSMARPQEERPPAVEGSCEYIE